MVDPNAILARLDSIRAATLQRLAGLTQDQLDWLPPAQSEAGEAEIWSLGEIFMHLAIDEHYLREQIARPLLEGVQPPAGVSFLPPPPPYAVAKEVIEFWFQRARLMTRRLIGNWPQDANLELQHEGGLRLMNGAEWLDGYGGHEGFHQGQIDTLMAQLPQSVTEA